MTQGENDTFTPSRDTRRKWPPSHRVETQGDAFEETRAADTVEPWPPELWENTFLPFEPLGLWYFVMAALEKEHLLTNML